MREIAQSGIHRVGESVESVLGRLDTSQHDAVTKADLVNATALMFILIVGLVFIISVIIIRKCKWARIDFISIKICFLDWLTKMQFYRSRTRKRKLMKIWVMMDWHLQARRATVSTQIKTNKILNKRIGTARDLVTYKYSIGEGEFSSTAVSKCAIGARQRRASSSQKWTRPLTLVSIQIAPF